MQGDLVVIFVFALVVILLIFHSLGFFKTDNNERIQKPNPDNKTKPAITSQNNVSAAGIMIAAVMVIFFIYQDANDYESSSDQSNSDTDIESSKKQEASKHDLLTTGPEKHIKQMAEGALSPYTQKSYPSLVAKYGPRLPEIEMMRRRAVEMAINSGKCDFVEIVELSGNKSTIDNLHFFVDCKNKQRIYLDENQLKTSAQVLTQEEKSWTEARANTACREKIKSQTLIPSKVDIHQIFGTSFYKAPGIGSVVLKMDFNAMNAYGVEIPYTATCYFPPGEAGTIEISSRQ